jgi:hypothetical protein
MTRVNRVRLHEKAAVKIITLACSVVVVALFVGCASEQQEAKLKAQAKISQADAEKTALSKVPGGTIKESGIEKENGKLIWSFDIATDGTRDLTEVTVNAMTGEIITVEKETPAKEAKEKEADEKGGKGSRTSEGAKALPAFTHPLEITNPCLPLASLKQDILEGKEGGRRVRIERTTKPDVHRTFKLGSQTVEALAVEDREFEDGALAEVAGDFFAQADDGTVEYKYYAPGIGCVKEVVPDGEVPLQSHVTAGPSQLN